MSMLQLLMPTELESHWRRQYSLFQVLAYARRLIVLLREAECSYTVVRVEGAGGWVTVYSPAGSIRCLVNRVGFLLQHRPGEIQIGIDDLLSTGERLVTFVRRLQLDAGVTRQQLQTYYAGFFDLLADHALGLFRSFYYVEGAEAMFEKVLLENLSAAEIPIAVRQHSRPARKAHVMKIAEYCRQEPDLEKRVSYLQGEFPWLFSTDPFSPLPARQQFVEYAASFQVQEKREEHAAAVQLPSRVLPLIQRYHEMLYVKDKRDEFRRQAFFSASRLVDEICTAFGVTRDQLWYVMPGELEKLESEREDFLEEIARRKTAYLVEIHPECESTVSGEEAQQGLIGNKKIAAANLIRGKSGSSGIARGLVQLVKSAGDVGNFRSGRVLVATTTNPDYLPAMQKAIAFVTDEGGITSHAAIVAREMKRPCIVGTKVATQALKDGDEVEVDAEKGVVKILKRT